MTVDRRYYGQQTSYTLRDGTALSRMPTFDASPDEQATWDILLPGPGGASDAQPPGLSGWMREATGATGPKVPPQSCTRP